MTTPTNPPKTTLATREQCVEWLAGERQTTYYDADELRTIDAILSHLRSQPEDPLTAALDRFSEALHECERKLREVASAALPNNQGYKNMSTKPVLAFERALRLAWEQRCRVAVEALNACDVAEDYQMNQLETNHAYCVETVREALAAIGPLPPEVGT